MIGVCKKYQYGVHWSLKTNLFFHQKRNHRSIRIVPGNHVVVDMDTTDNIRPYITTMRAVKFDENGPGKLFFFTFLLLPATEVAVFGERKSTFFIDKTRLLKMDDDKIAEIISGIGVLKHKFIGSFPADMIHKFFLVIPFLCKTESTKDPVHVGYC